MMSFIYTKCRKVNCFDFFSIQSIFLIEKKTMQINNINNDFISKNNNVDFPLGNMGVNPNQSNIINIHNMNSFNCFGLLWK